MRPRESRVLQHHRRYSLAFTQSLVSPRMSSDDELELPQPRSPRSPSPPPLDTSAWRKRSYGEHSGNSSDVPLFSSDDLADASIENYTSPRRKKQYRRTWWEDETSTAAARRDGIKRAARRAKDSGVFMPSSDSSGLDEGFTYDKLKPVTPIRKRQDTFISPKRMNARTESRDFLREVIDECLEDNNEVIDVQ